MKNAFASLFILISSLSFGQITIGTGTNVDSNAGLCTPVSNYYSTSLSQFIYLASEINAQPGSITGLKFYLNSATALTNSDGQIDVWMGHTSQNSYAPIVSSNGADWIPIGTHTQVLTNGSFVQNGNLVTVTFTTPFAYNGTDNLVLTVDANETGDDGISILYYQTAPSTTIVSLMFRTDNALQNPAPLTPPLNYTGGVVATSVQAKYTRPIVTLEGLQNLSITDNSDQNHLSIYPNPVEDELFIESPSVIKELKLYDSTFKLVEDLHYSPKSIRTDKIQNGIYFLMITTEDEKVYYRKVIKK